MGRADLPVPHMVGLESGFFLWKQVFRHARRALPCWVEGITIAIQSLPGRTAGCGENSRVVSALNVQAVAYTLQCLVAGTDCCFQGMVTLWW